MTDVASEHDSDRGEPSEEAQPSEPRSWKFMTAAVVLGVVAVGFGARAVTRFLSRAKAAPAR